MQTESELILKDLSCLVHLGCTEEERRAKQEVRISLRLGFREDLVVCQSDKLEDAVCYAMLSEEIFSTCELKDFCTVEHLAYLTHENLKKRLPVQIALRVEVHKVKPPISGLLGGVKFCFGDSL